MATLIESNNNSNINNNKQTAKMITGALRKWNLPDESRSQIMRIMNLCTLSNVKKLFQHLHELELKELERKKKILNDHHSITAIEESLISLRSGTYALCFSAEMMKSFLLTIINARIHEPVLHRCRLIPILSNHIPKLRKSLITWYIELLSPAEKGFFEDQRAMVGLVLRGKGCKIPYLGPLVCEYLWPMQRFDILNDKNNNISSMKQNSCRSNDAASTKSYFYSPQKFVSNIGLVNRRKDLTGLLTHMILANEFINFSYETVIGEYLYYYQKYPKKENIILIKYACTLVLQVINADDSNHENEDTSIKKTMTKIKQLSSLSLSNIQTLRDICIPLKNIKGPDGYQIRTFLSSLDELQRLKIVTFSH